MLKLQCSLHSHVPTSCKDRTTGRHFHPYEVSAVPSLQFPIFFEINIGPNTTNILNSLLFVKVTYWQGVRMLCVISSVGVGKIRYGDKIIVLITA